MQCQAKELQACLILDKLLDLSRVFVQHLNLPIFYVRPAKWKKHFELINSSKDASRTKVIEMYPSISSRLSKKKDVNKADAILIARYFRDCRSQFNE